MKRKRKQNSRKVRKNSRARNKENRTLAYDPLERRQLLAFDTGIDLVGAALADADINSLVPNADGDVGPNHYVEIGEQTFTVYDRNGAIVEETSLNQFFLDAGATGDLFGEDLQSPRVIYDRLTERWFAIAVGDGNGQFAGNRIHVAFSDTSDPSGQWQQLDFVADITGVKVHDNPTLAVDADGVYFSTQNFENGVLEDVAIYSIPKADLFLPNPTLANISQFTDLSVFDYGISIQLASNFDPSDGTIFGFSTQSQDVNGSGNASESELNPSNINVFEIQNADGPNATLTVPTQVQVGVFIAPKPVNQILADDMSSVEVAIDGGLTHSLVEQDGSVFAAQSVSRFIEGTIDDRSNNINWFQILVEAGQAPVLANSPIHNDITRLITPPTTFVGDFLPDPPEFDTDPMITTPEFAGVTYFNPAIAVSESGLIAITFNSVSSFDMFGVTGLPGSPVFDVQGINTLVSVGLPVNGGQLLDGGGNPFSPRAGLQLEAPRVLQESFAEEAFLPAGGSQWGAYASLKSDPVDPNSFFSVSPFQDEVNDEWAVAVTQILPLDFQPIVPATPGADEIVIRLADNDPDTIEVEINGVVTDSFSQNLVRRLAITGLDGSDNFIVDYSNGDPSPSPVFPANGPGGLVLFGNAGTDTVQSSTGEDVDFFLDIDIGNGVIPPQPGFNTENAIAGGLQNGTFTPVTLDGAELPAEDQNPVIFQDIETVVGGSGNDVFVFETGILEGNAEGGDGDDRFVFAGGARIDGSVNGGAGFNTLDVQNRTEPTEIVLFSTGQNQGFNGRTLDGPIGQFNEVLDQFRDISLVIGPTIAGDSIQALNQFTATYTLTIPNLDESLRRPGETPDFVASSIEQGGAKMYFTDFELLIGSVIDDVFNVQSNDMAELPDVRLEGREGDDTFNFSSDSPDNFGVVTDIDGLFAVDGGTGANSLVFSDFGNLTPEDWLVLSARITGPLEVIYTAAGTFDVTVEGSDGAAPDLFILQSFLSTNTLNVLGHGGNDQFIIQDLSQAVVELFGLEGDDEYIIEQVNGVDDRNVTIRDSEGGTERDVALIAGTLLDEKFVVDLDSFESDQFEFIGVEEFGFDGRGGDDEFHVRAISPDFPIQLRGGDGNDVIFISSDAPANQGDLTQLDNDLTIDAGTGINRILISNESGDALDVEIFDDEITGLFNGLLSYTATGGVFGVVDENGNLDPNSFGGIDITGSNGADDLFQITSFLDQNSLKIDGRLGADEITIGSPGAPGAIAGVVVVDGASGGDTYTVFLENLSSNNVMIDDTGFAGDDTLLVRGSSLSDDIMLNQSEIVSGFGTLGIGDFFEAVVVEGLEGVDTITMTNSPADSVTLSGNAGNDVIEIFGTVGAQDVTIFGDEGEDIISIFESSQLTTIMAFGGANNDEFFVGADARGDVILDGQAGQDAYGIELTDNDTRDVQIVDMEGLSDLAVFGTSNADEFLINNTGVTSGGQTIGLLADLASLRVDGLGGSDTFNVTEIMVQLSLEGGDGDDIFNISSDAPAMSGGTAGIMADIDIDGEAGNNQLRITNETGMGSGISIGSSVITGLTNGNVITYQSSGGQFARPDGTIGGIYIITSGTENDVIDITGLSEGDTLRVNSGGGEDVFNVANAVAGDVLLDGGEDADTYNYQFGGTAEREVNIVDTGTMGVDELSLLGSEQGDQITLSPTGISDGASTLNFNLPIDSILIQGLGGPDTFTINGAPTSTVRLEGNDGDDTFIVNSTTGIENIDLFAGLGNDLFQFNGSSDLTRIDAFGADGNDQFFVNAGAFGRLFLDGEEGGDSYQVTFAGEGQRRIDTRDSGTTGFDETEVFGSALDDRIALRTRLFRMDNESVVYDENTERVTAYGSGGNDRFVVFGSRSPMTRVFAGAGDDNFVMNSGSAATQIDLHGGDGNDSYLIKKTTVDTQTNLFGENGNDRFNIGSTANQDNGNLGLIRGELNVFGGSNDFGSEDVLYVNDRGVNAAYSYMVTPSAITPIAGPANLPRANFAGINYNSSMEAVRLDGTDQANLFQVFASQTARYFIDGNSPSNANADILQVMTTAGDGSELFITNDAEGAGFTSFTNGNEIVQFTEIEDADLEDAGSAMAASGSVLDGLDHFFSMSDLDELDI